MSNRVDIHKLEACFETGMFKIVVESGFTPQGTKYDNYVAYNKLTSVPEARFHTELEMVGWVADYENKFSKMRQAIKNDIAANKAPEYIIEPPFFDVSAASIVH